MERRVQFAVLRHRCHGLCHDLLLAAAAQRDEKLPNCTDHHRPGDAHRHLPLHPHLQLLGGRLRCQQQGGWGLPGAANRHALQRCLPLRGLAADGAPALDRADPGDEAAGGADRQPQLEAGPSQRPDGGFGISWRDSGRPHGPLVLVDPGHGALLLRCLRAGGGLEGGHEQAAVRDSSQPGVLRTVPDGNLLVHVPRCVHRQEHRPGRTHCHHVRASGLLCGGRHGQGRLWHAHLGHRSREVERGGERQAPVLSRTQILCSTLIRVFCRANACNGT